MNPVQKQSVYLKTLFFLFFICWGISTPYFGIFFKHVLVRPDGTPAIERIGLIFFVMPLVSLIANIPAGIVADKFGAGKRLITIFCLGAALFAALIGLVGEAWTDAWGVNAKFIVIFLLLFFLNACLYPIGPMIDAETLLFLNRHSQREFYGAHRLWGTYGWSVSTILMGFLLWRYSHNPLIFYGAAASFALLGLAARSGIETRPAAAPIIIPWQHLKKDRLFQAFLVFIFLTGVVSNMSYIYTGYFFDDIMKNPLQIGLILGTWTIFEIPVMKYARTLIDRFGNRRLIVAGLLLNGVRLILFSWFTLETPLLWKWAAALLQGPGFGLMQLGLIDFVDRRAHPNMRATYLSITNVARMSLASALGGILGSWLIGRWDAAMLMRFCGVGTLLMIFFFVLLVRERRDGAGATTAPG
jgi:MFS family permease